jgi:hypothetical protein
MLAVVHLLHANDLDILLAGLEALEKGLGKDEVVFSAAV